jgi:hypothetical protein
MFVPYYYLQYCIHMYYELRQLKYKLLCFSEIQSNVRESSPVIVSVAVIVLLLLK